MTAILAWLARAREWAWAIGLVVGGVALAILRDMWRRDGARERDVEAMEDANERIDAGRQAVQDGRAGGLSPDERLRGNDGRW